MRKESIHRGANRILALMAICLLLYGCAQPFRITDFGGGIFIRDREEKLPLKAGLFLIGKTRDYAVYGRYGATKILMGKALETVAVESLGKVFQGVSLFHKEDTAPQDIESIITIEFGPETKSEMVLADPDKRNDEVTSVVELLYIVYDKKWTLLWEGKSVGHNTQQFAKYKPIFGLGGGAGGARAGMHSIPEWIQTARDSLRLALEQMNDQILISGKDNILKGK